MRRRPVVAISWVALLPLAIFCLLRVLRLDERHEILMAADVLTIWLLLPAYAVLAVALLVRGRSLAIVAGVVVVAHLAWVLPDLRFWPRSGGPPARGSTVRVMATNVWVDNPMPERAARTIDKAAPDVLVVVELTRRFRGALHAGEALRRLPHRIERPTDGGFGIGLYSRFPLSDASVIRVRGYPMLRAKVDLGSRSLTVVAVHTLQPLASTSVLPRQLSDLRRLAHAVRGPVVLAGDFNATRQHRAFRSFLGDGLRDAHLDRGRGYARTWPVGRRVPPFALLDHVVVSPEVAVRSVREQTIPGSDHRAVVAHLSLGRP